LTGTLATKKGGQNEVMSKIPIMYVNSIKGGIFALETKRQYTIQK
jgi:hypothetical protein